jgi:hypothetical protein
MLDVRRPTPLLLLFALPALLQLTACCCGEAWEQAKIDSEIAAQERSVNLVAYTEAANARAAVYNKLYGTLDTGSLGGTKACPEAEIRTVRGDDAVFRTEIMTVDHGSLPGAPAADDTKQFQWLNGSYQDELARIAEAEQELFDWNYEHVGTPERRWLGVFVTTDSRSMPSNFKKGFLSGPSFDGGWYVGSLVIVDLDADGAVLCHAPFSAENSAEVDVGDNEDQEKAIDRDFKQNAEDAAQIALEGISEQLKVNVVGLF